MTVSPDSVMTQWRLDTLARLLPDELSAYLEPGYEAVAAHSAGIVIKANTTASDIFGYSEQDVFGMNAWMLFATRSVQTLMQRLAEKYEQPYQVYGRHRDGTEFLLELKGREIELGGEPIRIVQLRRLTD